MPIRGITNAGIIPFTKKLFVTIFFEKKWLIPSSKSIENIHLYIITFSEKLLILTCIQNLFYTRCFVLITLLVVKNPWPYFFKKGLVTIALFEKSKS